MSFNHFQKSIKTLIDSFEKAREWADLNNCLQKLKKLLEKNNAAERHEIVDHTNIAKRLAQCLAPDFNVIHKTTLEIYKLIFEAELDKRGEDEAGKEEDKDDVDDVLEGDKVFGAGLGVYLSGLFGFYQYAAFEVKEKFLDIVDEQILRLTKEIHVCLGGFMVCMLPALDDQSEAISKRVEEILNKTECIVGTKMFFGTIWMTLLRSSRTRIGGYKFIEKSIPKNLEISKKKRIYPIRLIMKCCERLHIKSAEDTDILSQEIVRIKRLDVKDYYYFYYPIKGKLVINALIASMMDQSVYVNRMVLDFMNSHLAIHSNILRIEENSVLIETALNLITRKDFACLKKFSTWLLSHLEDEDVVPSFDNDRAIAAIIPALKSIFGERPTEEKKALLSITMIQTLLYENALITDAVMDKVTVDVIDYIQDYMVGDYGSSFSRDFLKRFRESCDNFLEHIGSQLSSVLKALGRDLSLKINEENTQNAVLSIQRIEFSLGILPIGQVENVNELLRPILSRILAGIQTKMIGDIARSKNSKTHFISIQSK